MYQGFMMVEIKKCGHSHIPAKKPYMMPKITKLASDLTPIIPNISIAQAPQEKVNMFATDTPR
jgi:hypothetical protein